MTKELNVHQRKALKFLTEHPETPGDEATEKLGWTPEKWFKQVFSCKFFDFTGKGWVVKSVEIQ